MAERKPILKELPDGTKMMPRDFSKVVMTNDSIIPPEKLSPTPSSLDGLSWEFELGLRYFGCEYIQDSGELLKLPQVRLSLTYFILFFYLLEVQSDDVDSYFVVVSSLQFRYA